MFKTHSSPISVHRLRLAEGWVGGFVLLIGLIIYLPTPGSAFSGTEGASFLDIPVGGGPAAMGSAYTAQASDVYAPVYNPGGLGFVPSTQVAGQHLSYLDSINYEFVSFVHPFKDGGGLGFSTQYLGSGSIPQTDTQGNLLGSYTSHYASYNVSYGKKFTQKLSLGITGKLIDAEISNAAAQAYAADFGALYRYSDRLDLGAALTNVGTPLRFISQPDPLPLAMHLAADYWPTPHWNTSLEGIYRETGLAGVHMGVEWNPMPLISIRAGYRTDTTAGLSAIAGLTTGIGIHMWDSELDYAWLADGDLGNTQYISFVFRFWQIEVPPPQRNLIHFHHFDAESPEQVSNPGSHSVLDPNDGKQLMELLSTGDSKVAQSSPNGNTSFMQLVPNDDQKKADYVTPETSGQEGR